MSRRRVERIRSSLLGLQDDPVSCPCGEFLALEFGDAEPVATMYRILEGIGLENPEQLRPTFGRGLSPKVCRADPGALALDVMIANAVPVLHIAFMLGLCTGVLFDPSRPVLWTQSSLLRRLELFDMTGFYV